MSLIAEKEMRKILISLIITFFITVSVFAQGIDFTTYDVLAKCGDVTVVVKNNDYRMVVGPLKRSTTSFMLGNTKDQAEEAIDKLIEVIEKDQIIRERRTILFCGVPLNFYAVGSGKKVRYLFQRTDSSVKIEITVTDCQTLKQSLSVLSL